MPPLALRLRTASPGLLALPWARPLGDWPREAADFRDLPVGPSRHLVRFVQADGTLYALKELPIRVARKEYAVLRELEARALPGVHAEGLAELVEEDRATLITEFLGHSWQFRRLFQRMPPGLVKYRERLLDAMAILLVDLHRAGVFWGDCSLANTLFVRDGQTLQAFLVDAETSEVHPSLSDGQRGLDLGILVENVAGDLVDLAARLGRSMDEMDEQFAAAESVAERYRTLWGELHREEVVGPEERYRIEARVRRLNELGFAVDELALEPADGAQVLRLKVAVANRRFHAAQLHALTGLDVGEGQATVLLSDLRAFQLDQERRRPGSAPDALAGARWRQEVLQPGMERACAALGEDTDPVQAYCDLLEVRWLLSEEAGRDVGDEVALAALAARQAPPESAARMVVVESPTGGFSAVPADAAAATPGAAGAEPGAGVTPDELPDELPDEARPGRGRART
ncbi:MAG TPA: DUF4032 domain-containing protein [Actinomycetes bacterium]|nr:DUF4032 domain-containing protein [Actinomycetes bacterium]